MKNHLHFKLIAPSDLPNWRDYLASLPMIHKHHPQRQLEYILSRYALWELVRNNLDNNFTFKETSTDHYSRLPNYSSLLYSISHTKGYATCLISTDENIIGLGLDCELKSRQIKDDVSSSIKNQEDEFISALELWTLKEAIFKALSSTGINDPHWKNFLVKPKHFIHMPTQTKGFWKKIEHPHLEINYACIKN